MSDFIEFDPVDDIGAGAFGRPGARTFVIQARKGSAMLSVLVEKEQVRDLAAQATQFLDGIALKDPEEPPSRVEIEGGAVEEAQPLFRARLIGIGYDPERRLVLIELREAAAEDDDEDDDDEPVPSDDADGLVARLYATRAQVRVMMRNGVAAVEGGRPKCPLCDFPMDPDGHVCPRWN